MIILITGASHTGKTLLAQKLLEKYHYPYISIDHIKMGLIRSGKTSLTPYDDSEMTDYIWPVIREIIKTAVENGQNLIVEGCYIPREWEKDFTAEYRDKIRFFCLVMTEEYILSHYKEIKEHACVIESRIDDTGFDTETAVEENRRYLEMFEGGEGLVLIEDGYDLPGKIIGTL